MAPISEPAPIFAQPIEGSNRAGNLIAHEIRRAIIEGRLEPEEVLREEQLARELGTSRTPVREALVELRNEGLVEARATQRAVVRAYNVDELRDIYGLRAILEDHAARLAAARATPAQVHELMSSIERFHRLAAQGSGVVRELVAENLVFHGVISDASGVPRLKKMIEQVMVIPARYRAYAAYVPEHRDTIERDHREIAAAIEQRKAAVAGAAMARHVTWTGDIAVAAEESRAKT